MSLMQSKTRSLLIIGVAFVVMITNNGFILAGLTTFDTAMLRDLGISVTALKIRDTTTILTLGLSVPLVGYLIDRYRVVPVVIIGLAMMVAGFIGYTFVHTSIELYFVHVILGGSQAFCGVVCHVVLISRWTSRNRGLALGTLVAGSSLGNAIVPTFNAWLLTIMPWRAAILAGAVAPLAMIPIVLYIYRERPAGDAAGQKPGHNEATARGAFRSTYYSANFWLLAITAALTVFCVLGLTTNLALYVEHTLSTPLQTASTLLFFLFIGAVAAQFISGFLADRVGAARVHIAAVGLMAGGALMLGVLPGAQVIAAVILFGVGWGGNSAMLQLRPATLFAGPAIGRTLAALAVVETLGGAIGPSMTGYLFDRTGSYTTSFATIGALAVLALMSTALLRRSATPGAATPPPCRLVGIDASQPLTETNQ